MLAHVRTPWKNIATVTSTQGLKGEVVVQGTGDLPFSVFEGTHVFFVPPVLKGPNEAVVESVSEDARGALVRFQGITAIDEAAELVGRGILVERSDIPGDLFCADLLTGRSAEDDERGYIGVVTDLMHLPANDVLVVEGPLGDILIPVIADCIREVPEDEEMPLKVHLLPGLVPEEGERS